MLGTILAEGGLHELDFHFFRVCLWSVVPVDILLLIVVVLLNQSFQELGLVGWSAILVQHTVDVLYKLVQTLLHDLSLDLISLLPQLVIGLLLSRIDIDLTTSIV